MKAMIKSNFKRRILPAVTAVVAFALVVLLIIVTRKTEVDASVAIGGKVYSATNKMKILEIIPNEAYEAIGPLVSDSQGYVKWTDIVSKQPKGDNTAFTKYLNDEVRNYLSAINQTICNTNTPGDGNKLQARLCNKLTGDSYTYINSYTSNDSKYDIAKKLNYDLNNFEIRFYKKNDSGSFDVLKKSDGSGYVRNVFSYAVFESSKMEDFTEVVFKKASDVTIDDVDSAALVYFSRYSNTYLKGLADAKYGSTLATVSNWTKGSIDLKASVAIHLYIENISCGKAVLYSSTEKNTDSNIAKICLMIDGIDGDYFIKDFAFDYNSNNSKRLYEGQRGWVDVSDENNLKLYLKDSATNSSKKNFELPFSSTMFINSSNGYATEANNNKNSYPCYNATTHQQALRRFSLEQNSENAFVQGFENSMSTSSDYDSSGNYNGTYYDDARRALGLEDGADIKYSQGVRYILGDFDNSDINTIKVLEIEPAGFYRYDADNIDDLSIIRRWFGISDEKNSDGSAFKVDEDIKINIEHCSMNALIGKNVDLATEYDLIIVGAYGKDRMNMGILKNVYSKENSKIQEQGYSNAVKENGETALELNGNDISEKMYNELFDYALRGMPIVFDRNIYFGSTSYVDTNTRMYSTRMESFLKDIIINHKGTNGNITYTNLDDRTQSLPLQLKYARRPASTITADISNYDGTANTSYSLDDLKRSGNVDGDGNITITFSGVLPVGDYAIKIYIDKNQDSIFAEDSTSSSKELYRASNVKDDMGNYLGQYYSSNGSTPYSTTIKMPAASKGYFAWKVEVIKIDANSVDSDGNYVSDAKNKIAKKVKSAKTGNIVISGSEATVQVLHILNSDGGTGSLDLNGSDFQDCFNATYDITKLRINVTEIKQNDLNALAVGSTDDQKVEAVNKELEKYSMIVMGFGSNYGSDSTLNQNVIDAINDYIEAGNAVMFSLDTMSPLSDDNSKNYVDDKNKGISVKDYSDLSYKTTGLLSSVGMKKAFSDPFAFKTVRYGKSKMEFIPYKMTAKNEITLSKFLGGVYFNKPGNIGDGFIKLTTTDNQSDTVAKLNSGQITNFPYTIESETGLVNNSDGIRIASTHAQYYALDFDISMDSLYNSDGSMNAQPVVWYTFAESNNEDTFKEEGKIRRNQYFASTDRDAMNNYYIYSYGNVTFTAAGANDISNANPNEMKLFVNTFTKALLSGNNLPVVEYTDAVLDDSVATYKSYVKFNYDKFANHKLSFSFRILDADLISNEDYIKDAVMYIYTDPDGSRTDGDYDPNRDIMLGHIHSSGTNGISLGDSGTSVIVGKEYIVDDLFDLIKGIAGVDETQLRSRLGMGTLKIGITALDSKDGKGISVLTFDIKNLFDLD
jgi:hypothetical protein